MVLERDEMKEDREENKEGRTFQELASNEFKGSRISINEMKRGATCQRDSNPKTN